MNNQEFEKFKMTLEAEEIQGFSTAIACTLSSWLQFLTLTKRFDDFSKFSKASVDVFQFLRQECEYKTERAKINQKLHAQFLKEGYLFHITKAKNTNLILENGILTLHDRFNQDMYKDCYELYCCWGIIVSKNKNMELRLIEIPQKIDLYNERFNSIYFTLNVSDALGVYGNGSELFDLFLDKLLENLSIPYDFKYRSQEEIRNEILRNLNIYSNISDKEKQIILDFYDRYYEEITDNYVKDKSIILVPKRKIIDENISDVRYQMLIKEPTKFDINYFNCKDIEYKGTISNEGLIAVTPIYEDTNKVKLKVQRYKRTEE